MTFKKSNKGQALPFGIASILFITILTLMLFNTGQVTSEKMRLTNTADAAVYSGLVWQARSLNLQAYMNRAAVANQVAIGQMVSLMSWSMYLEIEARNIDWVANFAFVIKPFTAAFYQATISINNYIQITSQAGIPILDTLIRVISTSQQIVHTTAVAGSREVILSVIKKNNDNYDLSNFSNAWTLKNQQDWGNFSKQYKSNEDLLRFAEVVNESLDPFTERRKWEKNYTRFVSLMKEGGTRLISGASSQVSHQNGISGLSPPLEWEWKGKDYQTLRIKRFFPIRNTYVPVGWGGAYASTTGDDIEDCNQNNNAGFWGNGCTWYGNPPGESLADNEISNNSSKYRQISQGYNGLYSYRDIADVSQNNKDPRLALAIEVITTDVNKIRTTSHIAGLGSPNDPELSRNGVAPGMFRLNDNFAGSQISAVSKGEIFFKRSHQRADGAEEYGNLFNPYWDVHLVSADDERSQLWLSKVLAPLVK